MRPDGTTLTKTFNVTLLGKSARQLEAYARTPSTAQEGEPADRRAERPSVADRSRWTDDPDERRLRHRLRARHLYRCRSRGAPGRGRSVPLPLRRRIDRRHREPREHGRRSGPPPPRRRSSSNAIRNPASSSSSARWTCNPIRGLASHVPSGTARTATMSCHGPTAQASRAGRRSPTSPGWNGVKRPIIRHMVDGADGSPRPAMSAGFAPVS